LLLLLLFVIIIIICYYYYYLFLEYITEFYHEPAVEHLIPTVLEMKMKIPKDSTTTIQFDFIKKHLLYADYPPDCARGFDVG